MKQIAAVNLVRLTHLADFLMTIPPEQFTLEVWVDQQEIKPKTLFGLIQISSGCGFAGCAIGWATYKNMFPGFELKSGTPYYKGKYSFEAIEAVFSINENNAYYFFHPDKYQISATPQMVAERIYRFCKKIETIRMRSRKKPTLTLVSSVA